MKKGHLWTFGALLTLLLGCSAPSPQPPSDPKTCQDLKALQTQGDLAHVDFHMWQKQDIFKTNRLQFHLEDPKKEWAKGYNLYLCGPEGFNKNQVLYQGLIQVHGADHTALYGDLGLPGDVKHNFVAGTYEVLLKQGKAQLRKTLVLKASPQIYVPEVTSVVYLNQHMYFSLKTPVNPTQLRINLQNRSWEEQVPGLQRLMLPVETSPDPVLGQYRMDLSKSLPADYNTSSEATKFYVLFKEGAAGTPLEYTNTAYSQEASFYYRPIVKADFEVFPNTLKVGQQFILNPRAYAHAGVTVELYLQSLNSTVAQVQGTTLTALKPGKATIRLQASSAQGGFEVHEAELTVVP